MAENDVALRPLPKIQPHASLKVGSSLLNAVLCVQKISSKNKDLPRVLVLNDPLLLLLDMDNGNTVKRVLRLPDIECIERQGDKVLIKVKRDTLERDWLFRVVTDARNSHGLDQVIQMVSDARRKYLPDWQPLPVAAQITSKPRLLFMPGMRTAKQTLESMKTNKRFWPMLHPRPGALNQPPPPQQPVSPNLPDFSFEAQGQPARAPSSAQPSDHRRLNPKEVVLRRTAAEDDWGFLPTKWYWKGRPVRLKEVIPGRAADRAGLAAVPPLFPVIKSMNGTAVTAPRQLQDALADLLAKGVLEVVLELEPCHPFLPATPEPPPKHDPPPFDPADDAITVTSDVPPSIPDAEAQSLRWRWKNLHRVPSDGSLSDGKGRRPHGRRRRKHDDAFWERFVENYEKQSKHWKHIKKDVGAAIDARLEQRVIPLDFEAEAQLLQQSPARAKSPRHRARSARLFRKL
ncbi:hypothetical protein DIPPA_00494 [Diplonema papillatum]|nr:hypothetical protein DIPPA_00494 [Diplonema papillatum]|eukprot:gene10079-15495_t